jgi:hypothetical protein
MAKRILSHVAGAAGLLALAVAFVGLDPFLGAGATPATPISIDRSLKADRLPVSHVAKFVPAKFVPDWRHAFSAFNPQSQAQTPFACDAAFSTISAKAASNFFGRCLT